MACHGFHELVENGGDGKDFLFPDAKEIIVITRAGDDRTSGVIEIGRFINDYGGIARPGNNSSLRTAESGPTYCRSTRDAQEPNVPMIENRLSGFQRRLADDRDQVVDADSLM